MASQSAGQGQPRLLLISTDPALAAAARGAIGTGGRLGLEVLPCHIRDVTDPLEKETTKVIVVDVDARDHGDLVALQGFMARVAGRVPVIVATEAFDDAVARWFLQIRVADFLRKPVQAGELLRSCVSMVQSLPGGDGMSARVYTFLPAAGGVGVTTLAIETAMLAMRASKRGPGSTCLVDLDFEQGACSDYLDLEPRLDIDEIAPHPERLDLQLLEVMFSKHDSGLLLLAGPHRPAVQAKVGPALVGRLLDLVCSRFENVVVDMPRHWRPWTDAVLAGSDRTFVVTDMTVPGLRAARRLVGMLESRGKDAIRAQVIVNRFEQTMLFGTGLRRADIERVLEQHLAGTVSNNYKLVREAIDRGVALETVKAGNPVTTDLRRIVFSDNEGGSLGRAA